MGCGSSSRVWSWRAGNRRSRLSEVKIEVREQSGGGSRHSKQRKSAPNVRVPEVPFGSLVLALVFTARLKANKRSLVNDAGRAGD
jgi:hypothetical protein